MAQNTAHRGPMRAALASLLAASLLVAPTLARAATPPVQPPSGPGGADYAAAEVVKRGLGRASAASFAFHAAGQTEAPRPVVVILPAWGVTNPQTYGGWIEHLARKGYLVLFPRYQDLNRTKPSEATKAAAALVRAALAELANDPAAKPDLGRVALLGHLAGAPIAVNLAATAKAEDLPIPKLVYAVMPGGIASGENSRGIPLADLSQLDPTTLVITQIGDRDHLASDRAAKRLLREASGVPVTRKLFLRTLSDDHGFPTLSATLTSPGSVKEGYEAANIKLPPDPQLEPQRDARGRVIKPKPQPQAKWSAEATLSGEQSVLVQQLGNASTDSLDYLAYWKTFDLAAAAAFAGRDAQALRADPAFVDMGRWSDGWPVKRLSAETPRLDPAPGETRPAASR